MQLRKGFFLLSIMSLTWTQPGAAGVALSRRDIVESRYALDPDAIDEALGLGFVSGIFTGIPIIEHIVDGALNYFFRSARRRKPVEKAPPPAPKVEQTS
ncbi:hypothetical protein K493DRAFT_81003 [Basidiobolus meristosporus CBS 931.73]|uniref:Uncharacterized protein n=1 Tax=Basidiobolus meristosporus CBS 931.73 TaxID=1314790 RepID=A0A1Y1XP69_9FUNG|nr:hypothetical protein K493DRAFT_81003 [Basidiobolus meristosporus CBS 931.73]|eukprot:ORX87531.1 hypothetical protein K493DRAFT_81003 [Basidiobolus meristosporus CBS 931.73]